MGVTAARLPTRVAAAASQRPAEGDCGRIPGEPVFAGSEARMLSQGRRQRADPLLFWGALPARPAGFLSGCRGGWVISSGNSTQNTPLAQSHRKDPAGCPGFHSLVCARTCSMSGIDLQSAVRQGHEYSCYASQRHFPRIWSCDAVSCLIRGSLECVLSALELCTPQAFARTGRLSGSLWVCSLIVV